MAQRTRVVVVAALVLLGLSLALTLLQSPLNVAAGNKVPGAEVLIASTVRGATYCQRHETLPRDTSAIRVWLDATAGPRVNVNVYAAGHVITKGARGSDWIGSSVTVPVRPLRREALDATVCVSFRLSDETILVQGSATPPSQAAYSEKRALAGRMWIEYLRPGGRSWLSQISAVARRMGLGRAAAGTWVALAAFALLACALALSLRLLFRELA